jgi:AraC-like DNA-binding protein
MKYKQLECISNYSGMNSQFPYNMEITKVAKHYQPHRHDYIEISFLIEGNGYEILNGDKHKIEAGTFSIILPYQIHELICESENPIRIYNICISLEAFLKYSDANALFNNILFSPNKSSLLFVKFEGEINHRILNILKNMYEEFNSNYGWKELIFKTLLTELLIIFERQYNFLSVKKSDTSMGIIWDILRYIYQNYKEPLSLKSLSVDFKISIQHLSSAFKKIYGINFHNVLKELRVKHALSILVSSNIPVMDICFDSGFQSYAAFIRSFKEITGSTPQNYRNQNMYNHLQKK